MEKKVDYNMREIYFQSYKCQKTKPVDACSKPQFKPRILR